MNAFNYDKAAADLYDSGCHAPEEIYDCKSEKGLNSYMKENGLNSQNYYNHDKNYGNSGTEGCYITTACVTARGLKDNCEELRILRKFRDQYMKNSKEGMEDIHTYYESAPALVATINNRIDASRIWEQIYSDMIKPCVELIKKGKYEETSKLYKSMTNDLNKRYMK